MSRDIIKKIKLLKDIEPSAEWKADSRKILLAEIKNNLEQHDFYQLKKATFAKELAGLFFSWKTFKFALRPALAVFSIIGLILGSSLSVSAAQMSLPGDPLYSFKIVSEKVQVALTFKKEKQTKIHVELAGKRINEVKKIKSNPLPSQNKNKKINVAMDKFQKEIAAIQTKLENLNNKNISPSAVMEVAKTINEKTSEYQEALNEVTADPEVSGETALKLTQGLSMVEALSRQAKQIVEIALSAEGGSPEEAVESAANCDTNQGEAQNANADGADGANTNTTLNTERESNTKNTLENTNLNPLPKKVYIKPVVPINTKTDVLPEEPEEINESELKVGIDLRQEVIE